jgi:hypothetical protein
MIHGVAKVVPILRPRSESPGARSRAVACQGSIDPLWRLVLAFTELAKPVSVNSEFEGPPSVPTSPNVVSL